MSLIGSVGQLRRGNLASPALVVAPLLLLAAACGTGLAPGSPQASESAALSSSSKRGDAGTQYRFELFDAPGASRTVVNAINNFGVTTGYYWDSSGLRHGFVRSAGGTITTFTPTGAMWAAGLGINDFGIIVGYSSDANGRQHGFVRKPNGSITLFDLPNPPAVDTNLVAINDSGLILGGYDAGNIDSAIPFLLRDGTASFPGEAPGAAPMQTYALGLNNSGLVSGTFYDSTGYAHGFLLHGTQYTTVDDPSSADTFIWTVNDRGQVVVDTDDGCGFIFEISKKTFAPLPCVGIGSYAYGINNRGQVVGLNFDSVDPNNVWHGLIATPVDE